MLMREYETSALMTTSHFVGETWTFLRCRAGHDSATGFLDAAERSDRLVIEYLSHDLERSALRWLRRHDEREYSFVDATSFQVMTSTRTTEVFAFDGDFDAAGFVELQTD